MVSKLFLSLYRNQITNKKMKTLERKDLVILAVLGIAFITLIVYNFHALGIYK